MVANCGKVADAHIVVPMVIVSPTTDIDAIAAKALSSFGRSLVNGNI